MGDARARIVEAAIHCIQREGIEAVTSRSIAKEANVNGAALNYYFGSKDKVLEIALAQALKAGFADRIGDLEQLVERHGDLREAMIALLDDAIESATRFPNVGFALVHETVSKQRYDSAFVVQFNDFLEKLFARAGHVMRGETEAQRRMALAQVWQLVVTVGLLPHLLDPYLGAGLADPKARRAFIRSIVDCHFAPAPAPKRTQRTKRKKR